MKNLSEFEGVEIVETDIKENTLSLIVKAFTLVETISSITKANQNAGLTAAFSSSMLTANSLINTTSAKCTLEHPPEDIDMKVDSSGDLVLRCYHTPCHEWDMSGNRK